VTDAIGAQDPSAGATRRRVAIITLGCKLNQADSETIARQLGAAGIDIVDRPAAADAYVINTCSVTHVADRKARHYVRMARRLSPGAPVVLTGCFVETAGAAARGMGADVVLGNAGKARIAGEIVRLTGGGPGQQTAELTDGRQKGQPSPPRTRAFVKVQEGCNDVCAFCIVPKTRGRETSVPAAEVVREVRAREAEGVREVVLTGTQLGAWGRNVGGRPAELIRAVLAETSVPRVRFSSLQPQDVTAELLALWDDPRLCRHFHLALQSGSAATLSRMRRRYTKETYRATVARIRSTLGEDVAITTDVIAGFPGETDAEFEESVAFVEEMAFAAAHVFPYSRRSGTTADKLPGHVPYAVKHERTQRLLAVARAAQVASLSRFTGRTMPVLWERARRGTEGAREWDGLTDNYIRVRATCERELRNEVTPARLTAVARGGFMGEAL